MASNGYLAEGGIRLVTVEDNDQLIATAAAAFFAAKAAAAHDGVTLSIVEPAGAYRPFSVQEGMYYRPEDYNLNPKNSLKGASPGYSTHGWGNRWDVNSAGLNWMIANGHRYGWTREFGTADPNHFKHDGRTATSGAGSSSGTTLQEDEDMTYAIECNSVGTPEYQLIALYGAGVQGGWEEIPTTARGGYFNVWREATKRVTGVEPPLTGVTLAEWNVLKSVYKTRATAVSSAPVDHDRIIAGVIAGTPPAPTPAEVAQAVRDELIAPDA